MEKTTSNIHASQTSGSRVRKINRDTPAARWNRKLLRGLEAALANDPEVDLARLLPSTYSEQLQSWKRLGVSGRRPPKHSSYGQSSSFPASDLRSRLDTTDKSKVISELSADLQHLQNGQNLTEALLDMLENSEVLSKSAGAASVMVFRVSEKLVAKVTPNEASATTEQQTLVYLEKRCPTFPAPRSHGFVRLGAFCLLFMTFVPGLDLETAWSQLDEGQKKSISCQIDVLFSELRSLPFPHEAPLGGIDGHGCKDSRKTLRMSSSPVMSVTQFEDFIFAGSKIASPLYKQLLRSLLPKTTTCVFTHADLRPANIMVNLREDGDWEVVAIIDWESSGFYPEYWETVKMTNNLTPRDQFDWYNHLPETLSLRYFSLQWLIDRLWDPCMMNS